MRETFVIQVTAKTKDGSELQAFVMCHNITRMVQHKEHTVIESTDGKALEVKETVAELLRQTKGIGTMLVVGGK